MTKLPAFQFYPADWRKDIGVQSLSYHDRGVWFEILCLMHESEQRGKLLLNGKPMPNEVLSRILGLDKQGLHQALERIKAVGVTSVDESGALINRRMVKDEHIRQVRKKAGEQGGNPVLLNQEDKQKPSKPPSKTKPLLIQSSTAEEEKKKTTNVVSEKPPDAVQKVFEYWQTKLGKENHSLTADRRRIIQTRLKCFSVEQLCSAIDGTFKDDWLMGRDVKSTKPYNDFETIFKNDSKVETLIEQSKVTGNGSNKNNSGKRSNAEIFRNRDASKFAGIDPQKQFGIKRG